MSLLLWTKEVRDNLQSHLHEENGELHVHSLDMQQKHLKDGKGLERLVSRRSSWLLKDPEMPKYPMAVANLEIQEV